MNDTNDTNTNGNGNNTHYITLTSPPTSPLPAATSYTLPSPQAPNVATTNENNDDEDNKVVWSDAMKQEEEKKKKKTSPNDTTNDSTTTPAASTSTDAAATKAGKPSPPPLRPRTTLRQLFRYANGCDKLLMIFGTLGAMVTPLRIHITINGN
jgi:hypothetical protein